MRLTAPALPAESLARLGAVLDRLGSGAREALGENFLGAYLQGSFAMGAGDEHSDVDFLIVTHGPVTLGEEQSLRALHAAFPDSPVLWAQHLEGSYVPADQLHASDGAGWLYVDNGSRELERSAHDDTLVMRWILHRYGITLAGPPARSLVEDVPAAALRDEARRTIRTWVTQLQAEPNALANAWEQQHTVLALCRFLYTLAEGAVSPKIAAGRWAIEHLDPQWSELIRRAIADRPDPWGRVHRTVDQQLARRSRQFVDHVAALTQSHITEEERG